MSSGKNSLYYVLGALRDMYLVGTLDEAGFGNRMTTLAYEFMINDEPGTATSILTEIPVSYFKTYHLQQMKNDPNFAQTCRELSKKVVFYGFVSGGPEPTQDVGIV